jgi:hypothetical protein
VRHWNCAARLAHNQKVGGSNPSLATIDVCTQGAIVVEKSISRRKEAHWSNPDHNVPRGSITCRASSSVCEVHDFQTRGTQQTPVTQGRESLQVARSHKRLLDQEGWNIQSLGFGATHFEVPRKNMAEHSASSETRKWTRVDWQSFNLTGQASHRPKSTAAHQSVRDGGY